MKIRKSELKKLVEETLKEDWYPKLWGKDSDDVRNFLTFVKAKFANPTKIDILSKHLKENDGHLYEFEIHIKDVDSNKIFDIT